MEKLQTNILILGMSGVGKSSFVNYLYGQEVVKTGAGRPVTGMKIEKLSCNLENIILNIYDSWGLEANKSKEWKKLILN